MPDWAYYNDADPNACEWVRNLIDAGAIAPGFVDNRSIKEVQPEDLREFRQVHMFCGVAVWSYALRLAGWPDDRSVFTGSCPCQSFSAAGKQKGFADERHLWPEWFRLIRECRPAVVFGEQVAAAIRHGWLDLVQSELEGEGYACGKAVLGAASVGAPHLRQRLYFVADAAVGGHVRRRGRLEGYGGEASRLQSERLCDLSGVADTAGARRKRTVCEPEEPSRDEARLRLPSKNFGSGVVAGTDGWEPEDGRVQRSGQHRQLTQDGSAVQLEHSFQSGLEGFAGDGDYRNQSGRIGKDADRSTAEAGDARAGLPGPTNGFWRDADWLRCRDAKWRPVEPGTFPLVAGASSRMEWDGAVLPVSRQAALRGYGNALCAPVAAAFIQTAMECL